MLRRVLLSWLVVLGAAVPAWAQMPFPRDLIPTRTALARLGLERQWVGVVPLVNEERVLLLSMSSNLVFAQTNKAGFHAFDAETDQHLWSARLGNRSSRARPASVNSFAVFVTNLETLFALDRRTGRTLWTINLGTLPSSATECNEDLVVVGLASGKYFAYALKTVVDNQPRIASNPTVIWNWQTGGPGETRPKVAGRLVAFGSDDGRAYVSLADERTMLFRLATGGAIGAGLGEYGTRLLLVPSADYNLYGVDLLTANVLWTFPSGAPISQAPLVAGDDIFVVNDAGRMSSIDAVTGAAHWTSTTEGGRLLTVGARRVYLESADEDLFIIDRKSGQMVASPRDTLNRVGLNLRPYDFGITNMINDRLYFGTTSGMVVAIRELGEIAPRPLRDPKAKPFGYIPPEGVPLMPPAAPASTDSNATDAQNPGTAAGAGAGEVVPPPGQPQ